MPALTPSDQLRALRCTPDTPIELARCELTGQLLIKSKASTPSPVTVDFIIAPEQSYFTPLRPGDWLTLPEGLCSQRLADLLANQIFDSETNSCEAYEELRGIDGISDVPQRLMALMDWLDAFSDSKNVTGQDEQLLLNMLREKQGVCQHKSTIFQLLCHYWGIPARQVRNTGHRFVEISPDGGHTWRQYQLGGGGQSTEDITEPDWGEYGQPGGSDLKPPATRGYAYSDRFINSTERGSGFWRKIEGTFQHLEDLLLACNKRSVLTDLMHQLKDDYSAFIRGPENSSALPHSWGVLLSPQMFCLFGDKIQDWECIIEKSAWNFSAVRNHLRITIKNKLKPLYQLIHAQEPDVHYLNWLCDLYHSVPHFLKYELLAILQTFSGSCDSCQLKSRVKGMLESYSLEPEITSLLEYDLEDKNPRFSQHCINLFQTMTLSRSLLGRLSQPCIHQQLHHQPVGNSIIIPEKLMSGEAAFLNVSKSTSYKPITPFFPTCKLAI